MYGDFRSVYAHLLTAFKYAGPAFSHLPPSGYHIPPRMHAPHPIFVRPDLFHALYDARFYGAVKCRVRLFNFSFAFVRHLPRKTISQTDFKSQIAKLKIEPRPDDN
jgi:hypothetical protein